jgi:hypothetical protein
VYVTNDHSPYLKEARVSKRQLGDIKVGFGKTKWLVGRPVGSCGEPAAAPTELDKHDSLLGRHTLQYLAQQGMVTAKDNKK